MPRPYLGPKLWLDRRRGKWTILDGRKRVRTAFTEDELEQAEAAIQQYAGGCYNPIRPAGPRRNYKTPPQKGVYVVGYGPYVKIGISLNVAERISSLQTGAPEKITLYAVLDGWAADEVALHRRFAAYRLNGEWFRLEGEVASWVESLSPNTPSGSD